MSAKNSGSHLVIEFSSDLVFQLIHQLLQSEAGLNFACTLWPTPAVTFELTTINGEAHVRARRVDGEQIDYNIRVTLNLALGVRSGQTVEEFANDLLSGILPQNVIVTSVGFSVAGGGTALAIGVFFQAALQQNEQAFANFAADFLQGQDIAIAASTELLDRFVLRRPEMQAILRQALAPEFYTPDDPNNFASLSAAPPDRLRLDGRGEFQTEDCGGVDADWWIYVKPFFQDGLLKVQAEYDYDTDTEDGVQVFFCILGFVFLGSSLGFLAADVIGSIVGGVLGVPDFGLAGGVGGGSSLVSCGDKCFEITARNPARPDGRFIFALDDRQSVEASTIDVDGNGLTVFGTANLDLKITKLQVREVRSLIYPTAASVCAGGAVAYQPASFLLFNPYQPYEEYLGYERPQICEIALSSNLEPYAEVYLMPQNAPPDGPFRVHGVHQQRVEIRIKPNAQPGAITGSAIVKTNTPPVERHVRVTVVAPGPGQIEVDPLVLEFEQRDEEILDLASLTLRRKCAEPGPPAGRIMSVGASFEIRNSGPGTLHVCDLVLDDPAGVFQLNPRPYTVLNQGRVHIPVVLNRNANVNQQYTATVSVLSTDPNRPQVDVTLRGTALTPPQGVNVGGPIAIVDNFLNAACLVVQRIPGQGPVTEIDLERWKELFTDPALEQPEGISIYSIGLQNVTGRASLVVQGDEGVVVKTSPMKDAVSAMFPEEQMKTAEIHGLEEGESVQFRVSSFQVTPLSKYTSAGPAADLWASGDIAALAAEDGLQVISLKNPAKPERLLNLPEYKLVRLAGSETMLFGLSGQGLEIFSYTPAFKHLTSARLERALDLAAGERSLLYVLTEKALLVVDAADAGRPAVLYSHELDTPQSRLIAIRSALYLYSGDQLVAYSLARPRQPERVASLDLPGGGTVSHWGSSVAVHGQDGTQLFQFTGGGQLIQIADYPSGHWAAGLSTDRYHRHLFSLLPDARGFTLYSAYRRPARVPPGD